MFTGLIEDVGRVRSWEKRKDSGRLALETRLALKNMALGSSVAVNGACLTVVSKARGCFAVDVSPETLRRTNLQQVKRGGLVNLERPLRLGERLGGHLVTAHVDGLGKLVSVRRAGQFLSLQFKVPVSLARLIVPKGSVAVDGISLTVNECRDERFSVMIIPFTFQHTNLHRRKLGDKVNIETDIIGKYVNQLLAPRRIR
ncbi:MAG: riboflavin synthase [Candidatus Binatia bacterium]